jgi:hypothetical protein
MGERIMGERIMGAKERQESESRFSIYLHKL